MNTLNNLKEHYKTILEASRIKRGMFKGKSPEEIRDIAKQEEARLDARRKNLGGRYGGGLRSDVLKSQAAGVYASTTRYHPKFGSYYRNAEFFQTRKASKDSSPIDGEKTNATDLILSPNIGNKPPTGRDMFVHGGDMGRLAAAKGFGKTGKRRTR